MDIEERLALIGASPTEEIITTDELKLLLESNPHPLAYDGFEPSGLAHLGSALLRAIKVEDMLKAGCRFTLLLADYHAMINGKLEGDLEKIQKAGKYLIHAWKSCGVDTSKIELKWVSDYVSDPEYWKLVIKIAKSTTLSRMLRCSTIMGRKEGEPTDSAQIIYPAMQCADIFYLGIDICQLGMDQRKVNILARELAPKLSGLKKPVSVHHHLMMGLGGPGKGRMGSAPRDELEMEQKMSKSKPDSCVFIHDTPEQIAKKIGGAYCPEKIVEDNPVLEICRYIIFRKQKEFGIERPAKFGGSISFQSYGELEKTYLEGKLHPADLKYGVSLALSRILEPSREYFRKNTEAWELYQFVYKLTWRRMIDEKNKDRILDGFPPSAEETK